jgi:predicted membrane protein
MDFAFSLLPIIGRYVNYTCISYASKTMSGFVIAILLAILSIVFAVKESNYWIIFVALATVLTFLSANRADKLYKSIN